MRIVIPPPEDVTERIYARLIEALLRVSIRILLGPPFEVGVQRLAARVMSVFLPSITGVAYRRELLRGVPTEIIIPNKPSIDAAILYLHGGAFCIGSASIYRGLTSRLALWAQMPVWVPDYRLAPESPYPWALDDAFACYQAMLDHGLVPSRIALAGDSAGGALALALATRLRQLGHTQVSSLALISPLVDFEPRSIHQRQASDPMVRHTWINQALSWYAQGSLLSEHHLINICAASMPPTLIQVGSKDLLLQDAINLFAHIKGHENNCHLEIYDNKWHNFQLQSAYLKSSARALMALAEFIRGKILITLTHTEGSHQADAVPR